MVQSELLESMSAEEFYTWMALEQLEPFGEYGAWLRSGILTATLSNIHRGKNQRPFKPADFMPKFFETPEVRQSARDQLAVMRAVKAAQDAALARKAKKEANAGTGRNRRVRKSASGTRSNRPA